MGYFYFYFKGYFFEYFLGGAYFIFEFYCARHGFFIFYGITPFALLKSALIIYLVLDSLSYFVLDFSKAFIRQSIMVFLLIVNPVNDATESIF